MGERKVLNKHYPDDFDPAKIPRRRQPKNRQIVVRVMLPMSIRCGTCGTYISKGTKFNSRKEDAAGEAYLGIRVHRFYIKCTRCSAEIAFKTDPRNSDYTVESGASRNFEPWREAEAVVDKEKRKRAAEEMGDQMRALENRAMDSKRDMDVLANLEETLSMRSIHARVSADLMLEILNHSASTAHHQNLKEEGNTVLLAKEDEELVRSITFRNSEAYVKRIEDDDDNEEDFGSEIINESSESALDHPTDVLAKDNGSESANKEEGKKRMASKMPKFIVKAKPAAANPHKKHKTTEAAAARDSGKAAVAEGEDEASEKEKTNVLDSLFQYDTDESDD